MRCRCATENGFSWYGKRLTRVGVDFARPETGDMLDVCFMPDHCMSIPVTVAALHYADMFTQPYDDI